MPRRCSAPVLPASTGPGSPAPRGLCREGPTLPEEALASGSELGSGAAGLSLGRNGGACRVQGPAGWASSGPGRPPQPVGPAPVAAALAERSCEFGGRCQRITGVFRGGLSKYKCWGLEGAPSTLPATSGGPQPLFASHLRSPPRRQCGGLGWPMAAPCCGCAARTPTESVTLLSCCSPSVLTSQSHTRITSWKANCKFAAPISIIFQLKKFAAVSTDWHNQ